MKKKHSRLLRVRCCQCGKDVAARKPKGGDGTGYRPVKHNDELGRNCIGRLRCGHEVLD